MDNVPSFPLPKEYRYARCDVVGNRALPNTENIRGSILMRQMPEEPLQVMLKLRGFPIDHRQERHHRHLRGFHGHEFGDMSDGCSRQGGHYNPHGVQHGGPQADVRHPGDFGNIQLEEDGSVALTFNDSCASLFGHYSMLGRGFVIHAGEDDLGLKDDPASKRSGNAGARIACCSVVACPKPTGVWP